MRSSALVKRRTGFGGAGLRQPNLPRGVLLSLSRHAKALKHLQIDIMLTYLTYLTL